VGGERVAHGGHWPVTLSGMPGTEPPMEFELADYDGMVLLACEAEAARARQDAVGSRAPWQYERGANHVHADMSESARVRVRQEVELAAAFEAALRRAYPERAFVISHIPGYAVSFYQQVEGAPVEDIPPDEPLKETAWCQRCQRPQPYRRSEQPDPEFPKVEWGQCTVCGDDVILRRGESLRVVLPSQ
jgi:hypothetical protein